MWHSAKGNRRYWPLLAMAFVCSFFFSESSVANVHGIVKSLQPVEGYVVRAGDMEFIIDLDAAAGISVGDIFSVVEPGEKLIHPVTNKEIGILKEVTGVLRVTRLGDGYSFARPIGDAGHIKRGDRISRFDSLKAIFWDYPGNNKPLFKRLRNQLPALKWQDYRLSQEHRPPQPSPVERGKDTLIFVVQANRLTVFDGELTPVREYLLEADNLTSINSPAAPMRNGKEFDAPPAQTHKGKRTSPPIAKKVNRIAYDSVGAVAHFPDNILMADLKQHADGNLLATTNGSKISIYAIGNKLELITEVKAKSFGNILSLKWWTPEPTSSYLAVLTYGDDSINSTLYSYADRKLLEAKGGLDTILGSFDMDGDGRKESLLSQEFDADNFFGRRIEQMYWRGSELRTKNPDVRIPPKFNVISGQLADLTGDGRLEAAYVRNGVLYIYSDKKRIYASPQQMGGSLSTLTYKVDPEFQDYRTTTVFFEVAPVTVDIDADGRKELVVISSDRSPIRIPGVMSTIDTSRLMILNYKNGGFIKGTLGPPIEAAVQGLNVTDRMLFFVATETSRSDAGGGSRLQSFDLTF